MSFCCFKPFFGVFGGHCMDYYNKRRAVADDLNWMTLNSHFAPYTVTFRVESFTVDALVLRHDCFKIHKDAHILSAATVCGFWRHKSCRYSSGYAAEVVSDESAVVENGLFSVDRSLHLLCGSPLALHIEIYTAHAFPGDSMALL